jgi:hypothetical protein
LLKNAAGMKEILSRQNSQPFLTKFFLSYYMSAGYCQRGLVYKSGMIRNQIGMHNTSEMVTEHETPCVIPSDNSNSMQTAGPIFFENTID